MSKRSNTTAKDIRSRIKHSNVHLGTGVELERVTHSQIQQQRAAAGIGNVPGAPGQQQPTSASASYHNQPSYSASYDAQPATAPFAQEQHHLGAGPSFVSLTPSDSISNHEGRTAHQMSAIPPVPSGHHQHQPSTSSLRNHQAKQPSQSLFPRPPSPTADSTASFARQMNDGSNESSSHDAQTPNRPKRSMRRPVGMTGGGGMPSIVVPPTQPGLPVASGSRSGDRHARSARLMASVNDSNGRDTPLSMQSEEADDAEDAYGGLSPTDSPSKRNRGPFLDTPSTAQPTPTLGSLTQSQSPAALGSVLSALSEAGRKNQGRRIMRGMTAEEESRRRRVEKRMDEARGVEYRDVRHYEQRGDQGQGGIGRIGAVHRKVKAEWGFVTEDDFNPVALALSLLDESSLGSNRDQFEATKQLIEESLQGTVEDHYESFATAITLHNSVLSSLTDVQASVSSSRRRLRDSREALGSKRADLVQLWHRQQSVKEALRLLQTVEQLKNVPDRLETLLSEKHFLAAVSLLVKALKAIESAEMQEIGATADLRAYLRSQEGHLLEILVEEIHNHLYLKSSYCDRRWQGYVTGAERMPDVKWGKEYSATASNGAKDADEEDDDDDDGGATAAKLGGLSRTKSRLGGGRSTTNLPDSPSLKTTADDAMPAKLSKYLSSLSGKRIIEHSAVLGNDLGDLEGERSAEDGGEHTDGGEGGDDDDDLAQSKFGRGDPEADSFLYVEMLLEALARLGKLGVAMDVIHQRLPVEVHSLVETTIQEVDSRTEPLRRSTLANALRPESVLLASSSALAKTFGAERASFGRQSNGALGSGGASSSRNSRPISMLLRVSASETSQVESDGEVMRDLFWTLYSKLDAVLQGHRVVHEVASLISQRAGYKEKDATTSTGTGAASSSAATSRGRLVGGERLLDVWRPIQTEVRALLHEYLMDDTQSPSSRRNNIASVNEVLKSGSWNRDRGKKLFKLSSYGSSSGAAGGAQVVGSSSSTMTTMATSYRGGASAGATKRDLLAPVKRHEERLNAALRASVPGLVSSSGEAQSGILGLSAFSSLGGAPSLSLTSGGRDDARDSSSTTLGHHRILVKPDAFNISVLFQPTLAFVDRVRLVMPRDAAGDPSSAATGARPALGRTNTSFIPLSASGPSKDEGGFSSFLDEFVQDVFLPQLEEKVRSLFTSAVGGHDAFQEDPATRGLGARAIVKSAANVVVLVDSLYSMLRTTPFHRESYSRLIIQTIVRYYGRCHERFRELVGCEPVDGPGGGTMPAVAAGGELMLSATWAQHPRLAQILAELREGANGNSATDSTDQEEDGVSVLDLHQRLALLQDEENRLEVQLAARRTTGQGESTVQLRDLITSRKKLVALSSLQYSLKWLLTHINRFKATDESLPVSARPKARLSLTQNTLTATTDGSPGSSPLSGGATTAQAEATELKLPLSREMASRFLTLPTTYAVLSDTVLFTLRLELRARVIHHLDLAITEGNYCVADDPVAAAGGSSSSTPSVSIAASAEPDPHVVDLNADLSNLDDTLSDFLTAEDHRFLFAGMASLMDDMLISAVKRVKAINRPGVTKMIRNVLALQQNLKNIVVNDSGAFAGSASGGRGGAPGTPMISTTSPSQTGASPSTSLYFESRRFWELLSSPSPDEMLRTVSAEMERRKRQAKTSGSPVQPLRYGFEELKCALQLMLGLENVTGPTSGNLNGGGGGGGDLPPSTPTGMEPPAASYLSYGSSAPPTPTSARRGGAGLARAGTLHDASSSTSSTSSAGGKQGASASMVASRQKLNEYLIDLHQVLDEQ
ncbi:hypothetical protein BDZ90DRAFT_230216 [Jaminaea rosea]|uniref:Exocyst complex component Sec8 n=1 Tax=Jaminaea rosea TaxID=1569628 RepID=A0A316UVM5_9BASI|nr:hypothetical protein BDZ90DRAFT_230216 [Jaminaea rosea]PWN29329.1 hypothetical protein BDZ90DRAFT_230216 [Jaminaea rosea]